MPSPQIEMAAAEPDQRLTEQWCRPRKAIRVAAFTGGKWAPSRLRVQQYVQPLQRMGISIAEFESRAGLYPPNAKWSRPAWGIWNLMDHVPTVLQSHKFDVTLLQREMLSTFVTLEPFTKRPRVLDVDDAIWNHRRGDFARRLGSMCDHVICGNQFLAERFSAWNPRVSVLPTPVDANRFRPMPSCGPSSNLIVGWLGLSSGFRFLYGIENALSKLLQLRPDVSLRIVSDRPPSFSQIPAGRVQFIQYDRENEVSQIQEMTVGIMPIDDSEWSRGKCSFKMLLYMACGIPVVVSPFGMNAEVLALGNVGVGATSHDWLEVLQALLDDKRLRFKMGLEGRRVILEHYSVEVLAPKLAKILTSAAS